MVSQMITQHNIKQLSHKLNQQLKNEKTTDGPALDDASPVRTRIPEPITEPTPKRIKSIVLIVGFKVFYHFQVLFPMFFFLKILINLPSHY